MTAPFKLPSIPAHIKQMDKHDPRRQATFNLPAELGNEGQIRIVQGNENTWFVASDAARALGYTNPHKAIADHCKDLTIRYPLSTAGGKQEARLINLPDLLRLITSSRLPKARAFEAWVYETVLPKVLLEGGYVQGEESMSRLEKQEAYQKVAKQKNIADMSAVEYAQHMLGEVRGISKSFCMEAVAKQFPDLDQRDVDLIFRDPRIAKAHWGTRGTSRALTVSDIMDEILAD